MGRFENVAVFEDTVRLCSGGRLRDAVLASTAAQELILENAPLANSTTPKFANCEIIVSPHRTIEAAARYRDKRVAILNFASAANPGGGVTRGSSAQEEAICRVSTLYFSLNTREMWNGFYGPHRAEHNTLHNDDIIYTPKVVVFKSDTDRPSLLPERDWFNVDVITCAAPNLRESPSNGMNPHDGASRAIISAEDLEALHVKRFTRILQVAVSHGIEVLILGAFGCGAFCNDPKVVARAAKRAVEPFKGYFKTIEFAVYCSPRAGSENYVAFAREFN